MFNAFRLTALALLASLAFACAPCAASPANVVVLATPVCLTPPPACAPGWTAECRGYAYPGPVWQCVYEPASH